MTHPTSRPAARPKIGLAELIALQRGRAAGGVPVPPLGASPAARPKIGLAELIAQQRNRAVGSVPDRPMEPPPSISDAVMGPLSENAGLLLAMGSGFLGAPSLAHGAGRAFAAAQPIAAQGQRENKTARALMDMGAPEDAALAAARNPAMMRALTPILFGTQTKTALQSNYEFAKQNGFAGSFLDWIAAQRAGAGEYGLQPIYGVDKDGNPVVMQLGKSGKAIEASMPEGFTVSRPPIKTDVGPAVVLTDPITRQPVATIQKDLAGAEQQKVVGKSRGEAMALLENMQSKMPGLETVVGELDKLSDTATYTYGGQAVDFAMRQLGAEPRESAIARADYIAKVDNEILPLLRITFGAAFTEKEGNSLKATLGDPNAHPREKQSILRAFIQQKRRQVQALAARFKNATAEPPAGTGPAPSGAPEASAPAAATAPSMPPPPPGFELVE